MLAGALLVGCSGPAGTAADAMRGDEAAVEDDVEQMIEEQAAKDGATVDIDMDGGAAIPETWPAEVPVPEGDVMLAIEEDGGHSLVTRVASVESAEAYADSLADAGFELMAETTVEDGGFRILESDSLQVSASWTGGDEVLLSVSVQPKS